MLTYSALECDKFSSLVAVILNLCLRKVWSEESHGYRYAPINVKPEGGGGQPTGI